MGKLTNREQKWICRKNGHIYIDKHKIPLEKYDLIDLSYTNLRDSVSKNIAPTLHTHCNKMLVVI